MVLFGVVGILVSMLLAVTSVVPEGWTEDRRLTFAPRYSVAPEVARNDYGIHLIWLDGRERIGQEHEYENDIYYKRTSDNGETWTEDLRLTNPSAEIINGTPIIGLACGHKEVYVVWSDSRSDNSLIYFKKSDDGGRTWSPDTKLVWNTPGAAYPHIAVDSSNGSIHVVWVDVRDNDCEIYYKNSYDGGNSWSYEVNLSTDAGEMSVWPNVTAYCGKVYVFWHEQEICFARSLDGGKTWMLKSTLTNGGGTVYSSIATSVVDAGGTLHLTFHKYPPSGAHYGVYYTKSNDNGVTWTDAFQVVDSLEACSRHGIAIDTEGRIHLIWDCYPDELSSYPEVYYRMSQDGGDTWEDELRLTYDDERSYFPVIVTDQQNIHVFWEDLRVDPVSGNYEIFYKRYGAATVTDALKEKYLLVCPNPFYPQEEAEVKIFCKLPEYDRYGNRTTLRIYNIAGELVKSLKESEYLYAPMQHCLTWDGTDDRGREVPSGIYLAYLRCKQAPVASEDMPDIREIAKIALIR